MKINKLAGLAAVSILVMSANAHSREFAEIYTDCGLGALIAPNHDAVAAVTNVTWDLGTTAISSNASSEDTCNGGNEQTASYILKSYAALENDLANGEGQHLNALYNIMGCAGASRPELSASLRSDFAQYASTSAYSSTDSKLKAEGMYNFVTKQVSDNYASSCSTIS